MTTGFKCKCGNKHLIDDGKKEDNIKNKKSCHKCLKIERLKRKANQRGKIKNYYLGGWK